MERRRAEKNRTKWDVLATVENVKYKIRCSHTTPACAISECNNRCCHECGKYPVCDRRCLNTPDKCGALARRTDILRHMKKFAEKN